MFKRIFRNRAFLIIAPIAVAVVLAGYAFALREAAKMDVRKFTGTIESIEGTEFIVLRGAFYPVPSAVPEKYQGERDFRFRVDGTTKFHSVIASVPTEQIAKNGGRFTIKPNELPKREGPGTLDELKSLSGQGITFVEVSFPYPVLERKEPLAESVTYRHLPFVFPVGAQNDPSE